MSANLPGNPPPTPASWPEMAAKRFLRRLLVLIAIMGFGFVLLIVVWILIAPRW